MQRSYRAESTFAGDGRRSRTSSPRNPYQRFNNYGFNSLDGKQMSNRSDRENWRYEKHPMSKRIDFDDMPGPSHRKVLPNERSPGQASPHICPHSKTERPRTLYKLFQRYQCPCNPALRSVPSTVCSTPNDPKFNARKHLKFSLKDSSHQSRTSPPSNTMTPPLQRDISRRAETTVQSIPFSPPNSEVAEVIEESAEKLQENIEVIIDRAKRTQEEMTHVVENVADSQVRDLASLAASRIQNDIAVLSSVSNELNRSMGSGNPEILAATIQKSVNVMNQSLAENVEFSDDLNQVAANGNVPDGVQEIAQIQDDMVQEQAVPAATVSNVQSDMLELSQHLLSNLDDIEEPTFFEPSDSLRREIPDPKFYDSNATLIENIEEPEYYDAMDDTEDDLQGEMQSEQGENIPELYGQKLNESDIMARWRNAHIYLMQLKDKLYRYNQNLNDIRKFMVTSDNPELDELEMGAFDRLERFKVLVRKFEDTINSNNKSELIRVHRMLEDFWEETGDDHYRFNGKLAMLFQQAEDHYVEEYSAEPDTMYEINAARRMISILLDIRNSYNDDLANIEDTTYVTRNHPKVRHLKTWASEKLQLCDSVILDLKKKIKTRDASEINLAISTAGDIFDELTIDYNNFSKQMSILNVMTNDRGEVYREEDELDEDREILDKSATTLGRLIDEGLADEMDDLRDKLFGSSSDDEIEAQASRRERSLAATKDLGQEIDDLRNRLMDSSSDDEPPVRDRSRSRTAQQESYQEMEDLADDLESSSDSLDDFDPDVEGPAGEIQDPEDKIYEQQVAEKTNFREISEDVLNALKLEIEKHHKKLKLLTDTMVLFHDANTTGSFTAILEQFKSLIKDFKEMSDSAMNTYNELQLMIKKVFYLRRNWTGNNMKLLKKIDEASGAIRMLKDRLKLRTYENLAIKAPQMHRQMIDYFTPAHLKQSRIAKASGVSGLRMPTAGASRIPMTSGVSSLRMPTAAASRIPMTSGLSTSTAACPRIPTTSGSSGSNMSSAACPRIPTTCGTPKLSMSNAAASGIPTISGSRIPMGSTSRIAMPSTSRIPMAAGSRIPRLPQSFASSIPRTMLPPRQ